MSDTTNEVKLYDLVLVVELQQESNGKNAPFISYRYPSLFEVDPFSASVTQFCFPDMEKFPAVAMPKEIFSFVLTEGDGERRFGYCLRKLPPGTGARYPVAFSIMAYFPCFPLYSKILEAMAYHYENSSMKQLTEFVDSMLKQRFPDPGETFEIKMQGKGYRFTRPNDSDSLLEHIDLDTILTSLDETNILIIFAGLLVERRIIFCSEHLSTLSSCIQTAVALVYPFMWQHIYIPVLPRSLLSFVCAPMPFVVGVLKADLDEVLRNPMDEVLLIDIDNDCFILAPDGNPNQDLDLIPSTYIDPLRKLLKASAKLIKKNQKKKKDKKTEEEIRQMEYEMKMLKKDLTAGFINFFVQTVGPYRNYIKDGSFDSENFTEARPNLKPFLEQLATAQMFEIFIQERIRGVDQSGFEKKIDNYQKMQAEMAKLGIEDLDSSSTLRKKGRFKGKGGGWSTLRNQFKRDQPTSVDSSTIIGTPTLVKTTTERTDGTRVAPPVPKRPQGPSSFTVPNKPLPKAPGTRNTNPFRATASVSDFLSRPAPVAPSKSKRNTWLPQTSPSDFSRQVAAAGAAEPRGGRGRGRGFGTSARARQRPVSVRPVTNSLAAPRGTPPRRPSAGLLNSRKRSLPSVPTDLPPS
mmetsp:Transcript_1460/g.1861  ORF Transcript_1460/g.1861 Transcript_1460/m.1861 type:complete len:633 (-) Transcript_1460:56-1954(-)